jgi:hypothetical protein
MRFGHVFGWVWRGRIRSPFVTGRLGLVQAACARLPPITPDFGRVKTAEFCTAESGVYSARFRRVFGRGLESPASGADADAQFPGDDLPRGAGRQKCAYLARVDGDWRIAGAIGVHQGTAVSHGAWMTRLGGGCPARFRRWTETRLGRPPA